MYLSRILSNIFVVFAALSVAHAYHEARSVRFMAGRKRDLLTNLIGNNNSTSQPATPDAPPAAQPPAAPASPTDTNAAKQGGAVGPVPSFLDGVLYPAPVVVGGGTPIAPTTSSLSPKQPLHPSAGEADTTGAGAPSPTAPGSKHESNKNGSDAPLSPGLIAVLSIVFIALLVAILFSCHRIRQSRQRRHRNLDDEILKHHHAGSVGYSEGSGYGMYVGKESPDLWRKNLDLFHRG
ncbi:hypothetical protein BG004_006482 [Podila humilis]|nr:hypothetical protein BG004_006482 [Podila humilis]